MTLVADRFLVVDARTIDLATGDEVQLFTSTAGGPTDQARWLARCDRFFALRHRTIATLVDYGLFGECQRFEAWQAGDAAESALRGGRVVNAASAFLAARGLTPLAQEPLALRHSRDGRVVVVPDAACGYELAEGSNAAARRVTLDVCGRHLVQRPAVAKIADLLSDLCDARPRAIALWGPPGSGVRTASRVLARAARLQGFVPLAVPLPMVPAAHVVRAVGDRSLFLIHTRTREVDPPDEGWRALLQWAMEASRGHVLLFAGRTEVARVAGLPLAALTEDQLIASVEPGCIDEGSRRRIVDAARRAHGLPGRFAERLWEQGHDAIEPGDLRARGGGMANRVAESQPVYGGAAPAATEGLEVDARPADGVVAWPVSRECAALRQRVDEALKLLAVRRRAPGERLLRQTIGALARRSEWPEAARGAVALGGALLARGRIAEAGTVLNLGRTYLAQTRGLTPLWLDAAVLSGHQAIDAGRFDQAESILVAGFEAARSRRSLEQEGPLRLALARCFFWRGRFDEADRLLQAIDVQQQPPSLAVRLHAALSRVAIGRRQVAAGVAQALAAVSAANRAEDAVLIARAARALAFAHLAVGDLEGAQRDVVPGIDAARRVRCSLTAVKLRLLQTEVARRQGHAAAAGALFKPVERTARAALPATIRAHVSLLAALLAGASPAEALGRPSVCAQTLALFLPADGLGAVRDQLPVDDVVDILRCCQVADEEGVVLRTVCEKLRTRLSAAAIAFVAPHGVVMASDGSRFDRRMAERVLAVAEPIPPHAWEGNVEGGAPIRYGGASIAALVARWSLGTHVDTPLAAAALTLAATAAGPLVAEALARLRPADAGARMRAVQEILGESRPMDEVRQAIERASAAPFPVLVEGESGSGKELVARAIHRRSPRRDRPFCSMNCAALPDDLVESELFGHARGAFTGAVAERPGVFEEAHTGTLFLDEIGELSMRAQAKVLRTIQEGELRRVGENVARRVDVRFVAATNRDLRQEVAAGRFRLDLLYRLDVLRIGVPPLRERAEDIGLLADVFWREATSRIGSKAVLGAATVAALARYAWPGNVRELQNVLAATAVRSPRRGIVPPTALPPQFHHTATGDSCRLDEARRGFEDRFIRAALVRCGGRRSQAATELGITRQGLTKLMARLGID